MNGSERTSEKEKADIAQNTEDSYTVRLYFAEPDNKQPGERVFDVSIQGKMVLKDMDIVKETGGRWKSLVKECKTIQLKDALNLTLTPIGTSETLISGIEIIRE